MKILYMIFIKPWHLLPFKKADYLTVISNYLYNRALRNGVKVPIEIVPNGVDLEKFNRVKGAPFDHDLGIKLNEKVIITVSRLVKKNGVDDLIKAGQYLKLPFKILIIGSGPDEKKLKRLTKKLDLEEKILFLSHIQYDDLPKYYSIADVFVRPSLSEGLGNVFLEAMAAGVPIIGTSVGGIPDFLQDRETGLFCQVRNPKSIAQKIEEILIDEPLRETIIRKGRQLVSQKYNWSNISQQMEQIYQKLS